MPYVKTTTLHEKSRRLLKGYDITPQRLSSILICSVPKARSRINNPGTLTGDEWLLISRRGHIPMEEIREVFMS